MHIPSRARGFISLGLILVLIIAAAVIGGGAYYAGKQAPAAQPYVPPGQASTTPSENVQANNNAPAGNPSQPGTNVAAGLKTYTNAQYGFSFEYPPTINLIAAPDYKSQWWDPQFSTEVVGIETQTDTFLVSVTSDITQCTKYSALKTVTISGAIFTILQATDGSKNGSGSVELRTINNGRCYDLARTVPAMVVEGGHIPPTQIDQIIQSFRFTN